VKKIATAECFLLRHQPSDVAPLQQHPEAPPPEMLDHAHRGQVGGVAARSDADWAKDAGCRRDSDAATVDNGALRWYCRRCCLPADLASLW